MYGVVNNKLYLYVDNSAILVADRHISTNIEKSLKKEFVYFCISQLIWFARAFSHVADFNTINKLLSQKRLKQDYMYHELRKTSSKFYRRYYDLISKFNIELKSLLRQRLSEPELYGNLVYKLKNIVGSNNFSAQFIKLIYHYKKIGYNNDV